MVHRFTTSGTRVAGGVLRLRWMLTAPSVITIPTPQVSFLNAVEQILARRLLRSIKKHKARLSAR